MHMESEEHLIDFLVWRKPPVLSTPLKKTWQSWNQWKAQIRREDIITSIIIIYLFIVQQQQ